MTLLHKIRVGLSGLLFIGFIGVAYVAYVVLPSTRANFASVMLFPNRRGATHVFGLQKLERNQSKISQTSHTGSEQRFLFPLGLSMSGGPNYHYKHVKVACQHAMYLNRTLVLAPISRHKEDHSDTHAAVPFNSTFDVTKLSDIVTTISTDEFSQECNNNVDAVFVRTYESPPVLKRYKSFYETDTDSVTELLGVKFPGVSIIPKTTKEEQSIIESALNSKCSAILITFSFEKSRIKDPVIPSNLKPNIASSVDRHLKRAPSVTHAADALRSVVCDGQPYLALHWRNKTGEQCSSDKWDKSTCKRLLSSLTAAGDTFTNNIVRIMSKHQLSCVYVAYLPYSQEIIDILSRKIDHISTASDIMNVQSTNEEITSLVDDDYMFSLLEQEICYRGEVFIGSAWSNWADFVASEFEAEKRPVYYLYGVRGSKTDDVANITITQDNSEIPRP